MWPLWPLPSILPSSCRERRLPKCDDKPRRSWSATSEVMSPWWTRCRETRVRESTRRIHPENGQRRSCRRNQVSSCAEVTYMRTQRWLWHVRVPSLPHLKRQYCGSGTMRCRHRSRLKRRGHRSRLRLRGRGSGTCGCPPRRDSQCRGRGAQRPSGDDSTTDPRRIARTI